jgi:hypothetical protein
VVEDQVPGEPGGRQGAVLGVGGRPEKVMTSPTFQVVPAAGVVMVAVGGVLPTVTVTVAVAERPAGSVTRSLAA